jgi:hypothetical protein
MKHKAAKHAVRVCEVEYSLFAYLSIMLFRRAGEWMYSSTYYPRRWVEVSVILCCFVPEERVLGAHGTRAVK